eukprot:311981-Pelagomonas_calceolata.AAC.2
MQQPYLQQANVQDVPDFLLQHNNKLFSFVSELMDIMLTGEDQSQADQPNYLAEGIHLRKEKKNCIGREVLSLHQLRKEEHKTLEAMNPLPHGCTEACTATQKECLHPTW